MENVSISHEAYMMALRAARRERPGLTDANALTSWLNQTIINAIIREENEAFAERRRNG